MENTADEIKRLRSCINDLISVLALPALWGGSESSRIIGTLLDVLLAMLRLDLAYARLSDSTDGPPIEVVRSAHDQPPSVQPQQVGQALGRWLTGAQAASRVVAPHPAGEGEISLASFSLSLQDDVGVLVVGSRRSDFPTEIERLLLRVAANQAGIGLQEARRSGEQKRVAEALEQRVAERTRQLTAVNEELRRSEANLAEAQRLSHTGSFRWSISTGEILWSDETYRIFQYDRTTTPTVERVLQRVHPEDAAFMKQTIDRASQDGKDLDFELRLLMPHGSVKHVRIVAHAVSDESGSLEFAGALMDVTAAKEAEDRIRVIIDTVPALIWTARPDGSLDFISQRWLDYVGMTLEQTLGRDWGAQCHPDDTGEVRSKWRAAVAEGTPFEAETRVRRFDGEYRWFLSRAFPLFDGYGHILGWYGNDLDIHDRKQAEEKLRQSEAYLHEAQKLGHMGSWAHNPSSGTFFASPELVRIFGRDPEQGTLTEEMFRVSIHPEDRPFIEEVADKARSERTDFDFEHRIVLPDGSIKHVHSVAHAVFDDAGDVVEFVGTIMDVTERKRAEEALRQAQAELAHAARVMTIGEMATSIAHEVNQPLSGVVINATATLGWLGAEPPELEEARDAIRRIIRDGKRANEVLARVRALSRKGTTEKEWLDLNAAVQEVVGLAQGEINRTRVTLQTAFAVDLPRVFGDRVQLQQVVLNLVLNGIEAMSGVVDRRRELTISTHREDPDRARVVVKDSGVGFDPEKAHQIFDAFYTTKRSGMGMGLSISRSIIENHGGRLWAVPNDGHGTTFQFTV